MFEKEKTNIKMSDGIYRSDRNLQNVLSRESSVIKRKKCKIKLKIDVQPIAAKRLHSKATSTVLCELAMAKPINQTLNARLKSRKIRLIINFESNRIMYSPQKGGNKAPKKNNKEIISAVFFISLLKKMVLKKQDLLIIKIMNELTIPNKSKTE